MTLLAGLSCSSDSTVAPPLDTVAIVAISPNALTLTVGDARQLVATPLTATGTLVQGRTAAWSSSSATVADVSASGMLTAKSAGTATISATIDGQTGSITATVQLVPVDRIVISPPSLALTVGNTQLLSATTLDIGGSVLTNRVVTWSSSDGAIASVSTGGSVLALSPGAATVTATSEGKSASATVVVSQVPVASVLVSPTSATMTVGTSRTLQATTLDGAGATLPGRVVSWSSSAPSIVSVNGSGVVTAIAPGSATVTATSEGKSASATITSEAIVPVASLSVTGWATLGLGQSLQLVATPRDAAGNVLAGRLVSWQSSLTSVATVDGAGLVTAVAPGSTTITATSEGLSSSGTITVNPAVGSVVVSPSSVTLALAATRQFVATVKDANGNVLNGQPLTWSSSTPAVATVSASGLVTGVSAGSATITTTSGTVSGTASVVVSAGGTPASISMSPGTGFQIASGGTQQFTATVKDVNGATLSGQPITWTSSVPSVATIDVAGKLTAVSVGSTRITAMDGSLSAFADIDVTSPPPGPPESITVTPATVTLTQDRNVALTVTVRDANGTVLSNFGNSLGIVYASSDGRVAAIKCNALCSAPGLPQLWAITPGTATATFTINTSHGPQSAASTATVTANPVIGGTLTATSSQVSAHLTEATVGTFPLNSPNGINHRLQYSSSDTSIVALTLFDDSTAVVIRRAIGTATITATTDGATLSTNIVVATAPTFSSAAFLQITPDHATGHVGGTLLLPVVARDYKGTPTSTPALSWSGGTCAAVPMSASNYAPLGNTGAISVASDGTISLLSSGFACVTVSASGIPKATAVVEVLP